MRIGVTFRTLLLAAAVWVLVYALATATCSTFGCAASHKGAVSLSAKDTTVGQRNESTTTVTPGRDLNVGGGSDSIALWLAILGLGIAQPATALVGALAYQYVLRPMRIGKENGKTNGT